MYSSECSQDGCSCTWPEIHSDLTKFHRLLRITAVARVVDNYQGLQRGESS